ncbi:hypothetical protein RHSIM_Rhsim12G0112900 [Rhododendron simsii]|uniref:Uncharacterized protein n=1 Tax=Rhododendron simsii TaxID=118357 RepID=A0A834L9D1_RHOSS|nr:hypothetical protein RHSIM_Rhsim12G0112900 [Rhododendron simsii]
MYDSTTTVPFHGRGPTALAESSFLRRTSYEEDNISFILGDKKLKLTKEHVKVIFGISCGSVEMVETNIKKESVALAKRLEIKEARLSAPAMKQKIKELKSSEKE